MLHPTRDLARHWRPDDAEKLALFEQESSVSWPGGGGWQTTPDEMRRWILEEDHLAVLATEDEGRIVSLCTLRAKPGQRIYTYIPHLNCHPDYHGKKHGKSVLHAAVDHAYRAGYLKVDLNTWAGNMKAVPLYKKTGFMWKPGTSVFMENFTPMARRHPLGRAFFERHDWYATLQREIDLNEDLFKRGRVKVYEYLWRADDGDFFRLVFDPQSWGIVEVETPDLAAGARLPDQRLLAGVDHTVAWDLRHKGPGAASVFLGAAGSEGIAVDRREILQLDGSVRLQAPVRIDPATPEPKQDPKAHALRTELVWDGTAFELSPGFKVQQAVDIGLAHGAWRVEVGERATAEVQLLSNLKQKAVVEIEARPIANARLHHRRQRVELAPGRGAVLEVPLTATQTGAVCIEIEANARTAQGRIAVKPRRLDLIAHQRGSLSGAAGGDLAYLCSDHLLLIADAKRGTLDLHHRLRGERTHNLFLRCPQFGPPYSWEDFFEEKGETRIERDEFGLSLVLRSPSLLRPGFGLERRVTLNHGPVVTVQDSLSNGTARAFELSRQQGWHMPGRAGQTSSMWAVGPDGGVLSSESGAGGRGLESIGLPQGGERWPEGWLCRQRGDGSCSGILWPAATVVEAGFGGSIIQAGGRVRPGDVLSFPPLAVVVSDGGWQTVRGWWRQLFGNGAPLDEALPTPARQAVHLSCEPAPLVLGADTKPRVHLQSAGTHKLSGTLELTPPTGWKADTRSQAVNDLDVDHPQRFDLDLLRGRRALAGPADLTMRFTTDEATYSRRVETLALPASAAPVRVQAENDGTWTLDNGLLRGRVAPAFFGSMFSLRYAGLEYLNSSYPEAGVRSWRNPWHGGIHPEYGRLWGRLHRERFTARPLKRRGAQGLAWHGIRLSCTVANEDARGHTLLLDYLMAPGVEALAVIASCRDAVGLRSEAEMGFNLWPAFADAPGKARFYTPEQTDTDVLSGTESSPDLGWKWGGLAGKDQALLLAAVGQAAAGGWAGGPEGCLLSGQIRGPLPAGSTAEGLFFLLPRRSLEGADELGVWSRFTALP